ncbi:exodeoxyribonuclease V subunit gamma [Marinobacterium sediminicola]|uniref:RecBCD enzyme subunit RecC n=1 Tax=Marinobacterium sediminicola TaxID=518898 RepID=A0ABY1S2M1_9GAMM|nr:exodeoxyribonuclease V subunit gamma [Marinobacterium sediminicola]ULG68876.1 exodeoxyribonuclease V subunit gamma [Marinobacterium sediminicola]SMR77514.1 DNA helicase/exodeoxyribonuclease V, gamma subunit [Marinobacterium sediminicola]
MSEVNRDALSTGLAIIHGNRLESLREVLVHWMRSNPLGVLENETILVQSNGIAQWLQLALARTPDDAEQPGCGIAAALDIKLPSAFLWQAYRVVLGADQVPKTSPYDKSRLTWRLLRLLPDLIEQPECTQLRRFLADDLTARKEYQLAERLADLYDQYQVYRADWLGAWAEGKDLLIDAQGQEQPLPDEQRWQPLLWRAIRADMDDAQRGLSRADLHRQFLQACQNLHSRPRSLPRRVIIFGISALPQQFIEALSALAEHTQVLLCVHNPCRHYWADIIDGKELLRSSHRRQMRKEGMPAEISDADLHLHAHPLLAAWGKQGRDYIRLLDAFDDPRQYRDWFQRIDLFDEPSPDPASLSILNQIQQDILELEPLPETPRLWQEGDDSLTFQVAHSRQREVEILHDQMLQWFQDDPDLKPRDIIVMVPDVNQYAPHIRSVFGRLSRQDPRFIPFTLNDQQNRGQAPLLIALELLLQLPQERFGISQLFDLLEVPALRERFGMAESDLPQLQHWIRDSGIRWGLDSAQRAGLELPEGLEQNTWLFGLKRMLLGYIMGDQQTFAEIEAYAEVGGLEAAQVGPLAELVAALLQLREHLLAPKSCNDWSLVLTELLERFLQPVSDQDLMLMERLTQRLQQWQEACIEAALERPLPLEVVRDSWLDGIDEMSLSQRFLAGAVNIATLMPMRAIPFRRVCLLGMNDGDYPRVQPPMDFDLMVGRYRPGDRSRREDDRYLFLEALLSARDALYISWVGRSVRDNAEQPPSVLVAQLRDHLEQGWQSADGDKLLEQMTTEHPLQPFSPRYFEQHPRLFTYAGEWREVHEGSTQQALNTLPPVEVPEAISLKNLQRFLRYPVHTFFNQRLGVWFDTLEEVQEEHEPFRFDRLDQFRLGSELIEAGLKAESHDQGIQLQLARWQRSGELPLGPYAERALREIVSPVTSTLRHLHQLQVDWQPLPEPLELQLTLRTDGEEVVLEDWIGGLYRHSTGHELALILSSPQAISDKGAPRWHRLVRAWLDHLAVSASGYSLTTFLVGPDTSALIRPMAAARAQALLNDVLAHYLKALERPAPLACRTGLALLSAPDDKEPIEMAANAYNGNSRYPGEGETDRYLQRAWPEFDALLAAGLEDWAQALYQPLIEQGELLSGEGHE